MLTPSQQTHSKWKIKGIPDILSIRRFVSFFISRAIGQLHFFRPSLQSTIFCITLNLNKQFNKHICRCYYLY